MDNILYLDNFINLYNYKNNLVIKVKPSKGILKYGKVTDRDKFLKTYSKILLDNKLNNNLFPSNITVIINGLYNREDKKLLINILEELNYKNIKFIKETKYLKVKRSNIVINCNLDYLYMYYYDGYGNLQIFNIDYNSFSKSIIKELLKKNNHKVYYLFGKNYPEFISVLESLKVKYFYYEKGDNIILELIKKEISKINVKENNLIF